MSSPNEKPVDPKAKPPVTERAEQLTDDAFRLVRLTRACAAEKNGEQVPHGPVAQALFVRCALIGLACKYGVTGDELVGMSRLAAWQLGEDQRKEEAARATEGEKK